MSSLYKLSISGVRSFSPKDTETIQFGSPLTLICGQNGCGKTTIIESLKYATTGDLPPNSKGGAFVNDPTIADRSVVNAEIKLGFISVDGKSMTVTRNMQLNRRRAARGAGTSTNTFKTLEGQLAVISKGEKTSISTKNLELDTRVPLYLGASKAVLDYVIFCHQDESLWPLSEAGVLKKRFDEIFEASKFTKVLDSLKAIRKDMATDIKLIQQSVKHANIDKARAGKIKERLAESTAKVEVYSGEIAALTAQIETLERNADQLFHSNQEFQQTLSEHERLSVLVSSTASAVHRLESSIKILPDSDEKLSSMLTNFEELHREKQEQLENVEADNQRLEKELSQVQSYYHELVRAEGSLATTQKTYEQNKADLRKFEADLLQRFHKDSWDSPQEAEKSLMEEKSELSKSLDSLIKSNTHTREQAATAHQKVQDELFREKEHLSYCSGDLETTSQKLKELRSKLASTSVSEESIELERSQLETLGSMLKKKQDTFSLQAKNKELEANKEKIHQLESELDDLMRKITSANRSSDLHSKIDLLKESRDMKKSLLAKTVASHKSQFMKVVGSELVPENAERSLEARAQSLRTEHENLGQQFRDKEKELSLQNSKVSSAKSLLSTLKSSFEAHSKNILAVIEEAEIPQYETLIQELEEDHKTAVYNLNTFEVTKSYKAKAVAIAKHQNCCVLCNRGMDKSETAAFVEEVQRNIDSLTAEKFKADVDATAKDLDELRSINIDVLEYRKMKAQICKASDELFGLESQSEQEKGALDELRQKVDESRDSLAALDSLAKPVSNISRVAEEIAGVESQIADLEQSLVEYGASTVSLSELQKLQQKRNYEVKELRQAVSDASDDINGQMKELARLENQMKDKQILIGKMELSFNELGTMKSSIEDLSVRLRDLQQKKAQIESRISSLERDASSTKTELAKTIANCDAAEADLKAKVEDVSSMATRFEGLRSAIAQYEEKDALLVEENREQLEDCKESIASINEQKSRNNGKVKELQGFINDASGTERNIRDNIEFRQTSAELERLQNELSSIDIERAHYEKEQYQEQSRKLRDQIAELNSQHYGKVGEVKQINDQIRSLQQELQSEFKDIDKQYHHEWLKLQTNMLVSNDLQTYSQALDNAIMKYHSIKMDEINRILRELWNQTYKGTDIDGIEIKCDVSSVTARGRSYNYRVVMYKKSAELDMRGRCSAGQKVLTSILIRLALAECFGTNCGMIALDEPTTNLDTENAESLANALNNIIDFRRTQKNFQLIVITHDEKFLSHINGDQFTDNFYRVERDENQHSVIKSLPIHLMQDE